MISKYSASVKVGAYQADCEYIDSLLRFRIVSFKMFGWDMGHIEENNLLPAF